MPARRPSPPPARRPPALRHGLRWPGKLLGLLIAMPLVAVLFGSLWRFPYDFQSFRDPHLLALVLAFGIGLFLFPFHRFTVVYVFGHELTHWIAAKLCLRKTGRFQVRSASGFVEITDPNAFITLAPYFVPLYFFLSVGLAAFALLWWTPPPVAVVAFFAWLGFCYAYHVVLTAVALSRAQTDMDHCGYLLSYTLILGANLLFLYLALILLTQNWDAGWKVPVQVSKDLFTWLMHSFAR